MLDVVLSAVCGILFLILLALFFFYRSKIRSILNRYGSEINHLSQALREAEQHQDALTHQLQQRDQKIENHILTLNELTAENSQKKAELAFFKDFHESSKEQRGQLDSLIAENSHLKATLEQEQIQTKEKIQLLMNAEQHLQAQFKALSSDIFAQNNKTFLEMADATMRATLEKSKVDVTSTLAQKEQAIQNLVEPLSKALGLVDVKIQALEKERVGAYENLKTQVHHLISSQKELRFETANLVKALRTPQVRGKWGEMQLRRVVEIAGMTAHCDFVEQASVATDSGRARPDMIIHLPGNHKIIVDAKAPLSAYLEALDMPDDASRSLKLQEHARHVRAHIKALSQRSYFEQFEESPDFVVLFLPGEMFFSAALEQDPELLEMGFRDKVVLATPTTLIALLRAVAYGWRQESLAENAKAISKLGQELSKRISDLAGHMIRLGKNIGHVVESYNQTVGTLERRVLVSARKFRELDSHAEVIEDVSPVLGIPRAIQALELTQKSSKNKDYEGLDEDLSFIDPSDALIDTTLLENAKEYDTYESENNNVKAA